MLAEAVGLDQRREAGLQVDALAIDGQEVRVAPQRLGAAGDRFARDRLLDAFVVVGDFEGAEAELADVRGGQGILAAALAAAERSSEGHGRYLYECKVGPIDAGPVPPVVAPRAWAGWSALSARSGPGHRHARRCAAEGDVMFHRRRRLYGEGTKGSRILPRSQPLFEVTKKASDVQVVPKVLDTITSYRQDLPDCFDTFWPRCSRQQVSTEFLIALARRIELKGTGYFIVVKLE